MIPTLDEIRRLLEVITPGPWSVSLDDTGGEFTGWPSIDAPEDADTTIIHRAGFHQEHWGDLSKRDCLANARLIALTPTIAAAYLAVCEERVMLRQLFRNHVIQADGRNWNKCFQCSKRWSRDEPEIHVPDCPAALPGN